MAKAIKYISISIGIAGASIAICLGVLYWITSPKIPKPVSDVPIEYKIGWWPYQDSLDVKELKARVVFDGLNLFNGTAVVEYQIYGSIKYKPGEWMPYIKKVHINERWLEPKTDERFLGQIEITPIISAERVAKYNGEEIEFTVKVQDYLKTGGWGKNKYNIKSQDKTIEFELLQRK